jgi:hypothetical protein
MNIKNKNILTSNNNVIDKVYEMTNINENEEYFDNIIINNKHEIERIKIYLDNPVDNLLIIIDLIKENKNFEIYYIFNLLSSNQLRCIKILKNDQICFNICVSCNNVELTKYFIAIQLNMDNLILYNCIVYDSKDCFELLENIAEDQFYSDYFFELCLRNDSVKTMQHILQNMEKLDSSRLSNGMEIIKLMKSYKCYNFLVNNFSKIHNIFI